MSDKWTDVIDRIKAFNNERDWDQFHTPENLAKSISIEAGELLECFQWNNDFVASDVEDELADVFMYAIMMSYKLDIDVTEILNRKINKNENRYNLDKSKGNSKKYTEL